MKEKAPAFQFYPKDYLSDENVSALSLAEEGLYWRAICYCWLHGTIPADPEKLARILGKGCTIEQVTCVQALFNFAPDNAERMVHKRLEKERVHQADNRAKRAKAGKASAKSRAYSREHMLNKCSSDVQQNINSPTPTPTTTTYDQSIYTLPDFAPSGLSEALQAWGQVQREKHRRTVSQIEVDALLMTWSGRLEQLKAAIIYSTGNGWKNIREKTSDETKNKSGFKPHTAASTVEKNEQYIKERYGQDYFDKMFATPLFGEEELDFKPAGGGGLALLPKGSSK